MRRAQSWWIALAGVLSTVVIALTWQRAGYGLDRTDEGLYLLLMADPSSDRATTFLAGYLLHPAYLGLGGDIVALRRLAMILCCVLVAVLVAVVDWRLAGTGLSRQEATRRSRLWHAAAMGVAACGAGVLALTLFPMTPSYNTVAFWGGLLTLTGLALAVPLGASAKGEPRQLDGWLLVGIGGGVAFLGKPTAAAALALLAGFALLLSAGDRLRALLAAGLGVALSAAGLLALSGVSPLLLARTVGQGVRSARLLGGHEHLLRLDPLMPNAAGQAVLGQAAPVALQVCLLMAATALAGVAWRWKRMGRPRGVVAVCLILAPAAVVFGTNVNYWTSMGRLSGFWIAALLLAVPPPRRAAAVAAAMGVVALIVLTSGEYSYRYPSRGTEAVLTTATRGGARVELEPQDAAATEALLAAGARHGLAGAPMLDTTGASPGYIYALGGKPLGSAWLIGGYPGSAEAAGYALSLESCQRLGQARILYAPDSPRRIAAIWDQLGVQPSDYRHLFSFRHVLGYQVQVLAPAGEAISPRSCARASAPGAAPR
ncbi:hypothetical protein [Gephyromycinifex aptenodytis]|uniref:hypothetical protein n=1 Tax=Gephyromycinifex aptenodytis TaxID=2716227 RepID=UPI0014456205|nr:hypothetical protein [Gephyromycinifex aptenodytis]